MVLLIGILISGQFKFGCFQPRRNMSQQDRTKCTLSNQELIEACQNQIRKISGKGGNAWQMSIPPDMNRDSDMIFSELVNRFKAFVLGQSEQLPCTECGGNGGGVTDSGWEKCDCQK